jgi:hypothetical protein
LKIAIRDLLLTDVWRAYGASAGWADNLSCGLYHLQSRDC